MVQLVALTELYDGINPTPASTGELFVQYHLCQEAAMPDLVWPLGHQCQTISLSKPIVKGDSAVKRKKRKEVK